MTFREKINDNSKELSVDKFEKEKAKEEFFSSKKSNRKIPSELRKRNIDLASEKNFIKRYLLMLKEDSQFLRAVVQFTFALLVLWIGIEFHFFMRWGQSGGQLGSAYRPPGVEGFLPISALISLSYWLQTGIINEIHPSGLFILIAILTIGLLLKKSFCSWLCPIGTISESLWKFGKKLFRKNLSIPKILDYPLRSLKYLLLLFFLWAIFITMDLVTTKAFIYSPYNKVADVKMYLFFANISKFSLWTIITLILLSVVIKNFWCRYLCPYGALLGILSLLSPFKIKRNKQNCIDCELCTKVCPNSIKVHKINTVWSDECTSCLECVNVCPVKNTLEIKTHILKKTVPNWIFASLIIGIFVGITGLAMLTGNWQNKISKEEYLKRFKELDKPIYQHFGGQVPEYGPND